MRRSVILSYLSLLRQDLQAPREACKASLRSLGEKTILQYISPALAKENRSLSSGYSYFFSDKKNENTQGGRDSQYGRSRRRKGKRKEEDVLGIYSCQTFTVMFSIIKFLQ